MTILGEKEGIGLIPLTGRGGGREGGRNREGSVKELGEGGKDGWFEGGKVHVYIGRQQGGRKEGWREGGREAGREGRRERGERE